MPSDLHVTSPLMSGPPVVTVQKELASAGFAPGAIDGEYGPTTAAAVRAFQAASGLGVDGIVGAQTQAALEMAAAKPAALPARSPSAIGQAALAEALRQLGVKEAPPGSNKTIFGVWFGVDGVPWCNIFVSYCFQVGAHYTIGDGFQGAGMRPGKGCAYVPTTEAWLRTTGLWVGRTDPLPGDIAIFNWDGGAADHIGIVEENLGGGLFQTVEGNTAIGNDSDGGEVMRRQRHVIQVDGFGRIV